MKLWMRARHMVRVLARRQVYKRYGQRPPFERGAYFSRSIRMAKIWDGRVHEARLAIEQEDYVLNP